MVRSSTWNDEIRQRTTELLIEYSRLKTELQTADRTAFAHDRLETVRLKIRRVQSEIVILNIGLAKAIVQRCCDKHNLHHYFDDLLQVALVGNDRTLGGLLRAIDEFDPGKGYAFSSCAVPWIRGAIQHYLRDRGYTAFSVPRSLINDAELRRPVFSLEEAIDIPATQIDQEEEERRAIVRSHLARLPRSSQRLLIYKFLLDYSDSKIKRTFKIKKQDVGSTIAGVLLELRQRLEEMGDFKQEIDRAERNVREVVNALDVMIDGFRQGRQYKSPIEAIEFEKQLLEERCKLLEQCLGEAVVRLDRIPGSADWVRNARQLLG